jgi:hypothetical protein
MAGKYSLCEAAFVTAYVHRGEEQGKAQRAKSEVAKEKRKRTEAGRGSALLFPLRALPLALCSLLSDQSLAQGLGYGFGLGVDLEFGVDVLEMEGYRAHAYA